MVRIQAGTASGAYTKLKQGAIGFASLSLELSYWRI
jgi:hypothetical protein